MKTDPMPLGAKICLFVGVALFIGFVISVIIHVFKGVL